MNTEAMIRPEWRLLTLTDIGNLSLNSEGIKSAIEQDADWQFRPVASVLFEDPAPDERAEEKAEENRRSDNRGGIQEQQNRRKTRTDTQQLSARETEILQLLAKGIPFAEIGDILSISPHTVTAHIKKIYRKLQVHSRGEAVYEAQCLGLLPER